MTDNHHNGGFVKIIVIVIILMLVFVMSGFNIRDGASINHVRSTATEMISFAKKKYHNNAHDTVSQYILRPGSHAGQMLNKYVITRIRSRLQKLMESPPAIQQAPELPLISFAEVNK